MSRRSLDFWSVRLPTATGMTLGSILMSNLLLDVSSARFSMAVCVILNGQYR